ncbi:MAG: phosphatase PAP2 family protein [Candidatus Kaiserbacteria bacterium]|nr:phosphatase PAP2 family protein [Candidatus Kaiserbacteria bacterium]
MSIFYAIHSLSGHGIIGDFLIVFFGEYFIYLVLAIFILVAYRAYKKEKNIAVLKPYFLAIIATVVARFVITPAIRLFYHHLRPFIALSTSHLLTDTSYSFPSGHTITMFALAVATYFFNKKFSYFLFAAGLIVGVARIAGGVHYPSDVVGGIVLGVITGVVIYKLIDMA